MALGGVMALERSIGVQCNLTIRVLGLELLDLLNLFKMTFISIS